MEGKLEEWSVPREEEYVVRVHKFEKRDLARKDVEWVPDVSLKGVLSNPSLYVVH